MGEQRATIIGHDWGAAVAWHRAQLRPDIFRAVALLSVPYIRPTWADIRPTDALKQLAGKNQFYVLYFQTPGIAEKELEADVDQTMRRWLYSASGDAPPEKRWRYLFGPSERFLDSTPALPETLPSWLTEQDLATFTEEFSRTGYRGALNWWRNFDRMWELTRFLSGAKVFQPSLYVVGEFDPVLTTWGAHVDALEETIPNLREKVVVPGAGHWIQQERPAAVNERLIEHLAWAHDADSDPLVPPRGHS